MKNTCLLCLWSGQDAQSVAPEISSAAPSPAPPKEKPQPVVSLEAKDIIAAVRSSVLPPTSLWC